MSAPFEFESTRLQAAGLWLAATLLSACGAPPTPEYFPLNPGLEWEYQVHEQNSRTNETRRLTLRNLRTGSMEVDGKSRNFSRRLASDGNEYWLAVEPGKGIQRFASRRPIDFLPRPDLSPRTVLKLPVNIDDWWEIETRPYILERVEPFRERFFLDDSKRIELKMQVVAIDATVEVPAGKFENCIQLEGTGILNVLADARIGASEVPVTHREWYAPGVGLVKLERLEELDTVNIVGGNIRMELVRFDP